MAHAAAAGVCAVLTGRTERVCVWQAQRILRMCPNESWLMKYRNFESLRKREREIASLRSQGRHGEAEEVRLFSHPRRPSTRTVPPPPPSLM